KPFQLEPVAHGVTPGGWWYAANNFCAAEHGGTHLDAPIHFASDRWTADQVPLERLVGPAVVVQAHLHFPGVGGEAAAWLTTARRIGAVGIAPASIDRGASVDFRAHRAFANANTPIFENLTNLGTLPPRGAVFIGLPMKIGGGSGGPLRAVALLPPPRPPAPGFGGRAPFRAPLRRWWTPLVC